MDEIYLLVYLDSIELKIRQDSWVINKAVHLSLGVGGS